MKIEGSCLCKKVRYSMNTASENIDHCHCTFCQKAHGAAFSSYVEPVTPENFTWLEGEELLSKYDSSSHSARLFCSKCGSSLVAWIDGGKLLAPTMASVDSDFKIDKAFHMFWSSKVAWCDVNDDLPKYDTYPPHMEGFEPTD